VRWIEGNNGITYICYGFFFGATASSATWWQYWTFSPAMYLSLNPVLQFQYVYGVVSHEQQWRIWYLQVVRAQV